MEAPTHITSNGKIIYGHFLAALHWQHIAKETYEVPQGVFNFCLQDKFRKQIIRNADEDLFFKGIDRGELGIVDLLIQVFKIRSKIWWLQKDPKTMEKIKLYGVRMEDNTVRDPTACKIMEHCHFFESKILIEVMRALTDVNIYDEEDDMEANIGKYSSFCVFVLKLQ